MEKLSSITKYNIIYADPPWQYDDKAMQRGGAERHYPTVSIDELEKMPVPQLCADDCVLFMWATFPKLAEGLRLIQSWGFEYKTCAFVWVKSNRRDILNQTSFIEKGLDPFWGMGRWTRSNVEIVLLGIKGKPKRSSMGVHQIVYAPIGKHSKKPHEVRERIIALCGDVPRLEMFARDKSDGWDVFGNEVTESIEIWSPT